MLINDLSRALGEENIELRILNMYAGAGFATAARLKWDPSTYVPLRELLPHEYRAAAALLLAASIVLFLLAHLALAALYSRRARRLLLVMYGCVMVMMVSTQTAWGWWTGVRLAGWAHSAQAEELRRAMRLREHLAPLLQDLSQWHPLPQKLNNLIKEAEADAPRNGYVAVAALAVFLVLQPAAAALSLLLAARTQPTRSEDQNVSVTTSLDSERRPLRTAYKNGRLVLV
ncbi:PREDICTED: uncharacterized protein LOC106116608 isoform X1 [Papilio xuthus]|uniref:Uncharacterized protein LOC106116608 isoform X1 n=2 Tax=Papilio xuthus TaxID=66420 RepID=A0AAJ6Z5Z6_PAPXU|nr:PREDICTED: uncharacterized protein LOC106116608 isoform X1 [Papilio xuthus]